jgi:phage baseplate assembly protein W
VNVAFPFHVGTTGRTEAVDRAGYVRDLIELTLFTEPGERVDRPDFGCGLQRVVFETEGPQAAAITSQVQGKLQATLHDLIEVRAVDVRFESSTVWVDVSYVDRDTGRVAVANLQARL